MVVKLNFLKFIKSTAMEIKINYRILTRMLGAVVFILATASILGQIYKHTIGHERYLVHFFSLDGESNLPTWYASMSLFFCSIVLLVIGLFKKNLKDRFSFQWLTLAFLFLLLSIDENVQLHEQTISPLRALFNSSGIFYFAWVIPAIFFVILIFIFFLGFLKNLPVRSRNLFLFSGAVYIAGSIGGEFVGGYYQTLFDQEDLIYSLITNCEEILEMLGILSFIYTLFDYISKYLSNFRINICN